MLQFVISAERNIYFLPLSQNILTLPPFKTLYYLSVYYCYVLCSGFIAGITTFNKGAKVQTVFSAAGICFAQSGDNSTCIERYYYDTHKNCMDSTVSYVNIFIEFIKFSDIRGTISHEIRQFNHAIICTSGHEERITRVICFFKQWNMF